MSDPDLIPTNKDLGQHWLKDLESLKSICDLAELSSNDFVLEIGPGPGDLTELILQQAAQVIAVEIDESLISKLNQRFLNQPKLKIVNADIRKFNLEDLPIGYKVVANIPYYLSGFLIRLLSESPNPPAMCVLLIQKEVAERLSARPGKLSLLGVTAQVYWQVVAGPVIKAHLFSPPPKVDSQVVRLVRRSSTLVPADLSQQFFHLINAAFAQRRKTLANSLSVGLKLDKQTTSNYLTAAGIEPTRRPQDLTLEEWSALTTSVFTDKA